jgi:2-polyprenyl-3-methyl-5-hydroxy-6-metoxy-1,4-benzoquinol methylase
MVGKNSKINMPIKYQPEYDAYWKSSDRVGESSCELGRVADSIVTTCGVGRTLDVGSGEGLLVASLLQRGVDALGLDVSEVVIDRCSKRLPNRFIRGSVLDLPFEDNSFLTVVSTDCMEHLANQDVETALKEMHRVTKRYLFLRLATTPDRDGHWHLTIEGRAWWEKKCFEAGFRKHPDYYKVIPYESLNHEDWQITIILEKIPLQAFAAYPLEALAKERNLHMDMFRESGERSDAHVIRYNLASSYIRQGDRVLDAACGLGYGSYLVAQLGKPVSVAGIDGSQYAVDYANLHFASLDSKLSFRTGLLPDSLKEIEDGFFDAIISYETLEHVESPKKLLSEFYRVLSPGGRLILSVPNDWADETGEDPNPYHLHVYDFEKLKSQLSSLFLLEAIYQQIASGCKKREAENQWHRMPRRLRQVPLDTVLWPDSEWCLMVAMKSPVSSLLPYRESIYGYSQPPLRLLDFEKEYRNPWIVRSMLEFHFRATSQLVLKNLAKEVYKLNRSDSNADAGAALAVAGYQLLNEKDVTAKSVLSFIKKLQPFVNKESVKGHALRWKVSHAYLSAQLLKKIGNLNEALHLLDQVSGASIKDFNPSLGTKIVDAAFEAGIISAGFGDISTARMYWKRGVQRAYDLLKSPLEEFVGDLDFPHEFPSIVAVEFLDSAVRCIKALRWTNLNQNRSSARILVESQSNWKRMLEERWAAMQGMERSIAERDEAIKGQAKMLEERWAAMQAMECLIKEREAWLSNVRRELEHAAGMANERLALLEAAGREVKARDEVIAGQRLLVEERWAAMQGMERSIAERDETIKGQAKMLEERWAAMQAMECLIKEREAWLSNVRRELEHAAGMANERLALLEAAGREVKARDEVIAGQRLLVEERWAAMQAMECLIKEREAWLSNVRRELEHAAGMANERLALLEAAGREVKARDEVIAGQRLLVEERWAAMQGMERSIAERDEAIKGQAKMLEERWAAMQAMECLIKEREAWLSNVRRELEHAAGMANERLALLEAAGREVKARDEVIAGQRLLVEERWAAMQAMECLIKEREAWLSNVRRELEHAAGMANERLALLEAAGREVKARDEVIAGQRLLVEERWAAMQGMERSIAERDETIKGQAKMLEERWAAMQAMECLIKEREAWLSNVRRELEHAAGMANERLALLEAAGREVKARDEVIAGQRLLVEERWAAMQAMECLIKEREAWLSNVRRELEHAAGMANERLALLEAAGREVKARDEVIAGQRLLVEERWAAMQGMERSIAERDEAIKGQAKMLEERWAAMQAMESMIIERDGSIADLAKEREAALSDLTERNALLLHQAEMIDRLKRSLGKRGEVIEDLRAECTLKNTENRELTQLYEKVVSRLSELEGSKLFKLWKLTENVKTKICKLVRG